MHVIEWVVLILFKDILGKTQVFFHKNG